MTHLSKLMTAAAMSVVLLGGCAPAGGQSDGTGSEAVQTDAGYLDIVSFSETNGSVIVGNPDASVELVEYASVTCSHCRDFHRDVLASVKRDYIATGKVRFVFQEFPTPPVEVALAGFALARCAGEDGYMDVLDDFFGNQDEIFEAGRAGTILETLQDLGKRHGVKESEFETCITNPEHRRAVAASDGYGRTQGVNSTPSIFLNGVPLQTAESRTAEGLSKIINAELVRVAKAKVEAAQAATEESAARVESANEALENANASKADAEENLDRAVDRVDAAEEALQATDKND